MPSNGINFAEIKLATLQNTLSLVREWLPDGVVKGGECVARNPQRLDRKLGSFKINLRTGAWSDFAIDESGGDLISLAAYIFSLSQADAARHIASMLGMEVGNGR